MPAKKNLTRHEAGELAAYWCPGCHARERRLAHRVHCPELGEQPPRPKSAPQPPGGPWDVLADDASDD